MHAVRILHANIPILNTMIYAYFSLAYSHCYSHIHFVTNIWLNSEFLRGGGKLLRSGGLLDEGQK